MESVGEILEAIALKKGLPNFVNEQTQTLSSLPSFAWNNMPKEACQSLNYDINPSPRLMPE